MSIELSQSTQAGRQPWNPQFKKAVRRQEQSPSAAPKVATVKTGKLWWCRNLIQPLTRV